MISAQSDQNIYKEHVVDNSNQERFQLYVKPIHDTYDKAYVIENSNGERFALYVKTIQDTYDKLLGNGNERESGQDMIALQNKHHDFLNAVESNDLSTVKLMIDQINVNYRPLYYSFHGYLYFVDADGIVRNDMPVHENRLVFVDKTCELLESQTFNESTYKFGDIDPYGRIIYVDSGNLINGYGALYYNVKNLEPVINQTLDKVSYDNATEIFKLLTNKKNQRNEYQLDVNKTSFSIIDNSNLGSLNDTFFVETLLERGFDPKLKHHIYDEKTGTTIYPDTILNSAIASSNLEVTKLLLQNGADPNGLNVYSQPLLQQLISDELYYDNIPIIEELLLHGADPNINTCRSSIIEDLISTDIYKTKNADSFDSGTVKLELIKLFGHYNVNLREPVENMEKSNKITPYELSLKILNNIKTDIHYEQEFKQAKIKEMENVVNYLRQITQTLKSLKNIIIKTVSDKKIVTHDFPQILLKEHSPETELRLNASISNNKK